MSTKILENYIIVSKVVAGISIVLCLSAVVLLPTDRKNCIPNDFVQYRETKAL
ncbi:hypothetical protein [Natranaerovirga hydrolytica]|uniref:hypothetical protein n=1 Tax=Natranaerovirga hydrolytica TaxID=680378 RepID=UPI001402F45F|nr:hypothetical protein [Natranaerovirga hydrolytica]